MTRLLSMVVLLCLGGVAAAAPDRCGGLEKLALQPAPLDVLGGRLRLRVPEGMKDVARQESIMAAPQPDQLETRLFLEAKGKKLVVLARETFRRAGKDLAAEVAPLLPFGPPQPFAVASGVRAAAAAPAKLDTKDEAVLALVVAAAGADGAVILLSFYVNPEAAAGGGCVEMARRVAATLAPGSRALDLTGGDRVLEDGITLTLGAGQVLVPQEGPDFAVYHVMPVSPLGDKGGGITVYLGHHPHEPAGGTVHVKSTAFGQPIELTGDATTVEAIVPVPGRDGLVAHVSVSAEEPALREALVKVASTLRRVTRP